MILNLPIGDAFTHRLSSTLLWIGAHFRAFKLSIAEAIPFAKEKQKLFEIIFRSKNKNGSRSKDEQEPREGTSKSIPYFAVPEDDEGYG